MKAESVVKMHWSAGKDYICTKSTSPGYKEGKIYTCYSNAKGALCLLGSDGFEDTCATLVSSFKKAD